MPAESPSRTAFTITAAPLGLEHNVTSVIERSAFAIEIRGGFSKTSKVAVEEHPVEIAVVFVTSTVYTPAGRVEAICPTPPTVPLVFVPSTGDALVAPSNQVKE